MKKYRQILFFLTFTVLSTSCKVHDVDVSDVHGFKVDKFSKEEVKFSFDVDVDNPNWFKIKIKKSNIDLYLGDKKVGKAKLTDKIVIKGNSSETHTVYVETDLKGLSRGTLMSLAKIAMKGSAEVEARGWVKAKALMIPKKIDVNVKENISLGSIGLGSL